MVALVPFENYERIDASDFDKASGVLFQLSEYLGRTQVPMEAAREVAINDMNERFDTETEPSGYKWFNLSDLYAVRRGAEHPILDDTGTKIKNKDGNPGQLRREATDRERFTTDGTSLWYSVDGLPDYWAVHQYGSEDMAGHTIEPVFAFKKGKGMVSTGERNAFSNRAGDQQGQGIPPRPFIGLSEDAEDEIIAIFDKWVDVGFDYVEEEYERIGGGDMFSRVGETFTFKSGRTGTITGVGPGAGGRMQYKVGNLFGPMV